MTEKIFEIITENPSLVLSIGFFAGWTWHSVIYGEK